MSCLIGYKYVIQAGDTLEKIALEHLGNSAQWEDIRKADGTPFTQADAAALQVGQEVCIPEKQNLPHPSNLQFWDIVSLEFYEGMFPDRANLYRYESLIEAIRTYPKFCAEGSDEQRKREAAAFLAHIAHETGMLKHVEEEKRENWSHYCDSSISAYPCAENQTYHGRGPIQLSWNYNYGALGKALGIDLLNNPELLKTDGVVAFQSALWFWMEPQFPKPSIHEVILGIWQPSPEDEALGRIPGFGLTINIINGGVECGPKNAENHDKVHNRIALYKKLVQLFRIEDENNLSCELMTPYS